MSTFERRKYLKTVLTTEGLALASGITVPDLKIHSGFTLIHCRRESSATTLAMTLAGRMNPKKGKVTLYQRHRALAKSTLIHSHVAFAGVPELSEVERLVTVHNAIRERAVWAESWWKLAPRNIEKIPAYVQASKLLQFNFDNEAAKATKVGDLDLLDRVKLQVVLALISRPDPIALVVDDIDSLRSLILRRNFIHLLRSIAEEFPVIAFTSNATDRQYCHEYLQIDIPRQTVLSIPYEGQGISLPSAAKKALTAPGATPFTELPDELELLSSETVTDDYSDSN